MTIEWKSEPTEVVALLQEADSGVAMLPQPFVTVAQTQVEGLRIAVDLTRSGITSKRKHVYNRSPCGEAIL